MVMGSMLDKMVRPDTRLRKQVLFGFAAFVVMGVLAILEFSSFLAQIRQLGGTDPQLAIHKLHSVLNTVAVINALASVVFATYFFWVGIKTLNAGRYPPEGMRVIRETKIQAGRGAKIIAAVHIGMALLVLSTNAVFWQIRVVLEKLAQR